MHQTQPRFARRRQLLAGLALAGVAHHAAATPEQMRAAIQSHTGGATPRPGKVTLEVASLVDNGNVVPVTMRVDSPMTAADHVATVALFSGGNPQPDVARFTLGPLAGKAVVSTRIRLATSQTLVAVARMGDGSFWSGSADVVVTLAACIEGEA